MIIPIIIALWLLTTFKVVGVIILGVVIFGWLFELLAMLAFKKH